MIVLVTGDRNWTHVSAIRAFLSALPPGSELIQGGAPGADIIARDIAHELQMPYHTYPAQWKRHGRAAGPIRNRQQLDAWIDRIEIVQGFHGNITESKGTKDMLNYAWSKGITTRLYDGQVQRLIEDKIT